jgi:Ca2+/H+ antiporter
MADQLEKCFLALRDVCSSYSTLCRILLVHVAIVKMLPLTRSGTAISLVLDLFLAGMVAHGIVHVERQLAARSNFVRSILASSTELAMVALLLQKETVAPLTTFLVGLVYAKLFVVGGLCLLLCGLNSAPDRDRCTSEWLLALCGAIVFAARSSAEGM